MSPSSILLTLSFLLLARFQQNETAAKCVKNRHVFTEKQGTIQENPNVYLKNSRCEWLIKGDAGETVTIRFVAFHTEHAYDRLFIHDGDSRASPLLASKTGLHHNVSITSTGPSMYLLLHTDSGEERDGFHLEYSINACPNNCSNGWNSTTTTAGICNTAAADGGRCECLGDHYGRYCQHRWCADNICNQALGNGVCDLAMKKCNCTFGFYGESCSISSQPNVGLNKWYPVTTHSTVFGNRAGHVSAYFHSLKRLIVYGGYSLKSILNDMIAYDFDTNEWTRITPSSPGSPPALYNHAGGVHGNSLIIYGGELNGKNLSNQLWLYDFQQNAWSFFSAPDTIPEIAGHTLTVVGSAFYVIGGRLSGNAVSSVIYKYDLNSKHWFVLTPMYGKPASLRLFGHSANYYEATHSIYVFGGFHLKSHAKIAANTNELRVYSIQDNIWSVIRTAGNAHKPVETSFHVAVIAADYLIIHGGWSEPLKYSISNNKYAYNLRCNSWVSDDVLTAQDNHPVDPRLVNQPVFSHSAVLKDHHTMLFTGGFDHISSVGSMTAFKLPRSVVNVNEKTGLLKNATHCTSQSKDYCLQDPSCRYCGEQRLCYSFYEVPPSGCSVSEHSICSKACEAFSSCEACASQRPKCKWCSLNNACYAADTATSQCNLCYPKYSVFPNYGTDSTQCKSLDLGWWRSGDVISSAEKCQREDQPPGITQVEYFSPKNARYPDVVQILQETIWQTDKQKLSEHEFQWLAQIFPYADGATDVQIEMELRGVGFMVWLNVSTENGKQQTGNVTKLIKQRSETKSKTENGKRSGANNDMRLFPVKRGDEDADKDKLWYNFVVAGTVDYELSPSLKIYWYWRTWKSYKSISRGFLKPYQTGGTCSGYESCMGCISDATCGWCPTKSSCMRVDSKAATCKDSLDQVVYLQRRQEQCSLCTDHFDCDTCLKDKFCSWFNAIGCKRSEYENNNHVFEYISKTNRFFLTCEPSCSVHETQESCLGASQCLWCGGRESCLSFNDYLLLNQFGQCYTFFDKTGNMQTDCSKFSQCSGCLKEYSCGWSFNATDPRIGNCVYGDFSGAQRNDSVQRSWAYDICPDVDECVLGIHQCTTNSTCINIYGGYDCVCDEGFQGDGKVQCNKTCWPPCGEHGMCNAQYECVCDLGWKGKNCSVDCGCNGHSDCVNQTGVCDQCQENTWGEQCQYCVNGSYGSATTSMGCNPCECTGYGDPMLNLCDPYNGTCFCTNNTDGYNCDQCKPGFSGDPKSGICVMTCMRSNILKQVTSGFISPYNYDKSGVSYDTFTTCLWTITSFNVSHNELIYGRTDEDDEVSVDILLRIYDVHRMSCFDSMLTVYDGVPPNPRIPYSYRRSPFKLLGTVCGTDQVRVQSFRSATGVLTVDYHGLAATNPPVHLNETTTDNGFLAEFIVLRCPDSCPSPFICLQGNCTCQLGFTGAACEHEICPNDCNSATKQGNCDRTTLDCTCELGFSGVDCSTSYNVSRHFVTRHLSDMTFVTENEDRKTYTYASFGGTMQHYDGALYIFGDVDVKAGDGYFNAYDIAHGTWKRLGREMSGDPENRYLHCSFVYGNAMFIYGGITTRGLSNEVWKYDFEKSNWSPVAVEGTLDSIAGHTCTVVGDMAYIIGGYVSADGLNEYVSTLHIPTSSIDPVKLSGGIEPVGVYSHVAVYDNITKLIYIHGGMSFYDEDIDLSHKTYTFDPRGYWNLVERYPGDEVPTLIGHVAYHHDGDGVAYIMGGYNDKMGFNDGVYKWNLICNRWLKISSNDTLFINEGRIDRLFASAVSVNMSFYIAGGLNDDKTPTLVVFEKPNDSCSVHTNDDEGTSCLADHGCHWCDHGGGRGKCSSNFMDPTNCNASTCTTLSNQNRACNTLSSCDSCLANHINVNKKRCQWCRCKDSTKNVCIERSQNCTCQSASAVAQIDSCFQAKCLTSTCKNCNTGCFWTNHFMYASEYRRLYKKEWYTYNCFMKDEILKQLTGKAKDEVMKHVDRPCFTECSRLTSCETCVQSLGVNAATKGCIWSDKRSECMSAVIVPAKCSGGMCGRLYNNKTENQCPASKCSAKNMCLSCIEMTECGWCSTDSRGSGKCVPGNNVYPFHDTCGTSETSSTLIVIDETKFNETWAYTECPLENECVNGHSDCKDNEVCEDRVHGYVCNCKRGYVLAEGKECVPYCHYGCGNGTCVEPDICQCSFGYTGATCNVLCGCNGHSNCVNETQVNVCLQCFNNTQGSNCEKCLPLFVGDPRDGGKCLSCRKVCSGNTDMCMLKSEADKIPEHLRGNETVVLAEVGKLKYGPVYESDVMCLLCTGNSVGLLCDKCITGYFLNNGKCVRCNCHGHSAVCNPETGKDCICDGNTMNSTNCVDQCLSEQCSKCVENYVGDPKESRQCYKRMNTDAIEMVNVTTGDVVFYAATPSFTNVDIRITIDVVVGSFEVFVTDSDKRFMLQTTNNTAKNFVIDTSRSPTASRTRRNAMTIVPAVRASRDRITTFTKYEGGVFLVTNLRRRVIITIKHENHDLRKKWFYVALLSVNKTNNLPANAFVYFRQDLPRIDLVLFFLVLSVILFFILCVFLIVMKMRMDYIQGQRADREQTELIAMKNRPLASFSLLFEHNKNLNVIRKRKNRTLKNESKRKHVAEQIPENLNCKICVAPVAVQDTEDNLAAVVTAFVQYPENEISSWNFSLGSGICQLNNQQLLQVKTSSHGTQGKRINTRILSTVA